MASLRKLGRLPQDTSTIDLDWTYQLLTTNAFNSEKQASTYGYIVRATGIMNGSVLDDGNINLQMHIMEFRYK